MNIFVAIMLCFSALGLLDKVLGGKLGQMKEFDEGLTTMGGLAVSTVGFYSIGITFVQNHADAIASAAQRMPFDPSVLIGCLLAPDMGALAVAQRLAASASIAVFAGALVAGGLGQTLGYQLPVFLAAVKKEEIPELMRGFIFGLIALPAGLFVGGLLLGLPCSLILVNMLPVLVLCVLLIVAFVAIPEKTTKCLIVLGNGIRIFSFVLFGIAVFGVFLPEYALVDNALVAEMLYMVLRMVIIACGGLVLSHLALDKLKRPIEAAGHFLGVNNESVVGLVLSFTQSLAMLPLYSRMDRRGKILNAAFSVAGAYVVGGQLAFVSSMIPAEWVTPYMVNKIVAGVVGVVLAVVCDRNRYQKN